MPTLSIVSALKHMFQLIANNWVVAAKFCLPWLLVMAVLDAWQRLSLQNAGATFENVTFDGKMLVLLAVNLVASSSIAVSWHRHILIDEPQAAVRPFRIDRLVAIYLLRNLLIFAAIFIPLVVVVMAATLLPKPLMPIWIAMIIIVVLLTVRLTISLPAIAIGRSEFGLQAALLASRKNNLPILGLIMATTLIGVGLLVVLQILISIASAISPGLNIPAIILFSLPFQFVIILLSTAMQTSLYGYFGEGRKF